MGTPAGLRRGDLAACRLYLGVPVACAAGVAGADLRKRIEAIAAGRIGREMEFGRKPALAMVGIAAIAVPIGVGILTSPASASLRPKRSAPNRTDRASSRFRSRRERR